MVTDKMLLNIIVFAILFSTLLTAQVPGIRPGHISVEQGLSQSTVYAIVQDAQGFMWFGTDDGLNRFDGYKIEIFRNNPANSYSISDNSVWSLLCDKKGNLWIGTINSGLDRYEVSENRFYHFAHNPKDTNSVSDNYITALFEDSKGNIWIGTRNKGINRFNPSSGTFTRFQHNEKDPTSLSNNNVWAICEDNSGNLWIATKGGLSKLNLKALHNSVNPGFTRYSHNPADPGSISGNNIHTINVDHEGSVWAGAWDNWLNRFDEKTGKFIKYKNTTNKKNHSISTIYIRSIYEDQKNNLWFATYNDGLLLYDRKHDSFIQYTSYEIESFYEDRSGILWLGTRSEGVQMFDGRMNRFKHYYDDPTNHNDLKGNLVMNFFEDENKDLWVGTFGGGLNHFNRDRNKVVTYLANKKILSICGSKDGSIWVGVWEGGVNRFDKKTGIITRYIHIPGNNNSISNDDVSVVFEDSKGNLWAGNQFGGVDLLLYKTKNFIHFTADKNKPGALKGDLVSVFYEDRKGTIWIGSLAGGLFSYQPQTNSFKHHEQPHKKNGNLDNNDVYSIYEDDDGIYWIGTYGGGLNRYDPVTETFNYFTEQNGLSNNTVYGILPDRAGRLWLSTNMGLSCFNPKTGIFTNYDSRDGLQGNEYNQGAYFASPSGELFFGGTHGFNSFFPDMIGSNKYVPPVYLTSFKVFEKPLKLSGISTTSRIELKYSQNFFSFEFAALSYTSPEKNQYRYMLEGFDHGWHTVSAQNRYASYTNLDPGEYTLRIIASNNDGVWNKTGTSVAIIIIPPFWKTWWFNSLIFIAVIGLIILVYKFRIAQFIKIEHMRIRIATDLHDELGSNLSGIALASQITQGQTDKDTYRLSEIRKNALQAVETMHDIVWFIKPDNDNPALLIDRMKDLAASLFVDVKYTLNAEVDAFSRLSGVEDRQNVFLIYKECLTNIVKHANCTLVSINLENNSGKPILSIADNGEGFDQNTVLLGNGIRNIQIRAHRINGVIKIISEPGKGTIIELYQKKDVDALLQ